MLIMTRNIYTIDTSKHLWIEKEVKLDEEIKETQRDCYCADKAIGG